MRIALDAMGGDNAPEEIIAGALQSADLLGEGDELVLVGRKEAIEPHLAALQSQKPAIRMVEAAEVIGMDEPPVESLRRKRNSSIAVMAKMAAGGEADALISAGNTGACVAAFQMRMRNLPGVIRPGIAVVFPTFEGPVTICDVGANIACKPVNLYQYGVMARLYSRDLLRIENPRVGLVNIGSEDTKGNETIKRAHELMKADPSVNFVGNIEGRDLFTGACDVAICDGFVGNVALKVTEGLVDGLFKAVKKELIAEKPMLAVKFEPVISRVYAKYDYNEYGGAPLLGVNGTAVICHGSSHSRTIKNAIAACRRYYNERINDKIVESLRERSGDEQTEAGSPETSRGKSI